MRKNKIILKKDLVGIKNPHLILKIKSIKKELKVIVDEEETKYKTIFKNKEFIVIDINVVNKKNIQIFLKEKSEYKELIKVKNKKYKRYLFKIKSIIIRILRPIISIIKTICKAIKFFWKEYKFMVPITLWEKYYNMFKKKLKKIFNIGIYNPFDLKSYNKWIKYVEEKPIYKDLEYNPLISILIPVYNIERDYLSKCLDSILNQKYQKFEVCLADDNSTLEETKQTLKEYEEKDNRIKVIYRKENGHISNATNSALEIAKGEFIGLMDNDDELTENALYEMVKILNENKEVDFIYSDEDKLDMEGNRCEPHFKPDYSPDSLYGGNYICHFQIMRKTIVDKAGKFNPELVGAQDFDFFLRVLEETTPERVVHIPKILYHWRKIPGSTADTIENKEYAIEAGKKAVEQALIRRKTPGKVKVPIVCTHYIVEYEYDKEPLVSIIIPTKDKSDILKKCVSSILKKTTYKNYEILIVDNNSQEKETIKYLFKLTSKYKNIRVLKYKDEFNYASINNYAVSKSKGEYLLFLNNDTEVITNNWIELMVGYAMQKHIGAVGTQLIYLNNTIQHGGVIVNEKEVAKHVLLNWPSETYGFYGRNLVPYNYSAVTAACMMISKEKLKEVSGFEEKLKVAYNDVDLCLKLLENNYYNIYLPNVKLYHYESLSRGLDTTKEKYKTYKKERDYLINNHKPLLLNDKFYNKSLSFDEDFMLKKKENKMKKLNKKNILSIFIILILAILLDVGYNYTKPSIWHQKEIINEEKLNLTENTEEDKEKGLLIKLETKKVESIKIKTNEINYTEPFKIYFLNGKREKEDFKNIEILANEKNELMFNLPEYEYEYILLESNQNFNIEKLSYSLDNININHCYTPNLLRILIFCIALTITIISIKKINIYEKTKKLLKKKKIILSYLIPISTSLALFCLNINFNDLPKNSFYNYFSLLLICNLIWTIIVFIKKKVKPEFYYLVISITMGILMILGEPGQSFTSWDEAIHYSNANAVSKFFNKEDNIAEINFKNHYSEKTEELREQLNYQYDNSIPKNTGANYTSFSLGNIPNALGLFLGRMLNLNLVNQVAAGRLSSLLIYSFFIFWGLTKIKSGKILFSFIALLPVNIFLNISYSYDPLVNSCIMVSLMYMIGIIQDKNKFVTKKDALIMNLIMTLGILVKATYFPLMLLLLIIPKHKFKNQKSRKKFIKFNLLLIVLIITSFVLPFFLTGAGANDYRGSSEVNSIEQVKFILKNPFDYGLILLNFFTDFLHIDKYSNTFNFIAYRGFAPLSIIYMILFVIILILDKNEKDMKFKITHKLYVTLILLSALVISTTALYVSFNALKSPTINGMQHRYLIPLIIGGSYFYINSKVNSKDYQFQYKYIYIIMSLLLLLGIVSVY